MNRNVYAIWHFVDLVTSPCTLARCEQEANESSMKHNIYYSAVFKDSPPCVLRSRSKSHNGCIAHLGIETFVGLLVGRPRGIANLAWPCDVQLEVDPLHTQRSIVQCVTQYLSLVRLDRLGLFQQHTLSRVVLCFPIIVKQYQSYTVLPHVGPHYAQPF